MIGLWLVGALCVLVALSQGWQIALLALVVAIVASVIEGNILSPRLLGHAVGVHPLVSLFSCSPSPSSSGSGARSSPRQSPASSRPRDGVLAAMAQQPSRTVSRRCGGAAAGAGYPRLQQWRG